MNTGDLLPVFVYGTLRSGQSNDRLLADIAYRVRVATVRGLRLHDAGWFPYAMSGDTDDLVVGEVQWLSAGHYAETLARLDRLEGCDASHPESSHYVRLRAIAEPVDGGEPVEGWVYVVGDSDADRVAGLPLITSGDWSTRSTIPA